MLIKIHYNHEKNVLILFQCGKVLPPLLILVKRLFQKGVQRLRMSCQGTSFAQLIRSQKEPFSYDS